MIKYILRKYSFTGRIVDLWNSLPACVVKRPSVDSFDQDVYYNCKATITVTGNRGDNLID